MRAGGVAGAKYSNILKNAEHQRQRLHTEYLLLI